MKNTILKVFNLNATDEYYGRLKHISFHSYEGELCSFIGLNKSEIRVLFDILCGNVDLDWRETAIYVKDRRIYYRQQLQSQVYALNRNNYGLRKWTVAEYLWLNQSHGFLTPGKVRQLEKKAGDILEELDMELDVHQKVEALDPLQLRMLEVVKGICYGASILIIGDDDFFGGMSEQMIRLFSGFLKRTIYNRMTAIMLGGTDTSMIEYPDFAGQTIIMHRGSIMKKVNADSIIAMPTLQEMTFGKKETEKPFAIPEEKNIDQETGIKPWFSAYSRRKQMQFPSGTLSVVICRDNLRKSHLYAGLSGRILPEMHIPEEEQFCCRLQGTLIPDDFFSFLKRKVVSLDMIGTRQDVFENFSIEDNLLLPSIDKFTVKQYTQVHRKLQAVISRERRLHGLLKKRKALDLNVNDRICLVLERWLIYRPRVLILFEPFLNSDASGASLILEYLTEFQQQGAAVIVIKSNAEYVESLADQIFVF